eukprot:snap_masked-scaffold_4-processed-gene-21.23-mRNA-1 protein AED:0.19 eAED:1.00 QI:0/-1/0/1/-1/1/1/0/1130
MINWRKNTNWDEPDPGEAEDINILRLSNKKHGNGFSEELASVRLPETQTWLEKLVLGWYSFDLTDTNQFKRTLLLYSYDGFGKSVFSSSFVAKYCSLYVADLTNEACFIGASYFITYENPLDQDPKNVIRNICDQLQSTVPGFTSALCKQKYFLHSKDAVNERYLRSLSHEDLFEVLVGFPARKLLNLKLEGRENNRVVILIDGISQCQKRHLIPLLRIIEKWNELTPDWLCLTVTATKGEDSTFALNTFPNVHSIDLNEMEREIQGDLDLYYDQLGLEYNVHEVKARAKNKIVYLKFLPFYLSLVEKPEEVELPEGLNNLYGQILYLLFREFNENYTPFFAPLLAAREPLKLSWWRSACPEISESKFNEMVEKIGILLTTLDSRVHLVHYTLYEFLKFRKSAAMSNDKPLVEELVKEYFGPETVSNIESKIRKSMSVKVKVGNEALARWCWLAYKNNDAEIANYVLDHIIYHLVTSPDEVTGYSREGDANKLFRSFKFLLRRLLGNMDLCYDRTDTTKYRSNLAQFLSDGYELYLKKNPNDRVVRVILNVIDKGRRALCYDPRELANQFLGRIDQSDPAFRAILKSARNYAPETQWWRPLIPSLEAADGPLLKRQNEIKYIVSCMVAAPDGKTVAVGFEEGYIKIFETQRGRPVRTLDTKEGGSGGRKAVLDLSFCKKRRSLRWLASVGLDEKCRLWDTDTGRLMEHFPVSHRGIYSVDIREVCDEDEFVNYREGDRNILYIMGDTSAKLWLYLNREPVGDILDMDSVIKKVLWARNDNKLIAAAGTKAIYLVQAFPYLKKLSQIEQNGKIRDMAFHPYESWLMASWEISGLSLWDVEDLDSVNLKKEYAYEDVVETVEFTEDGLHFGIGLSSGVVEICETAVEEAEQGYVPLAKSFSEAREEEEKLFTNISPKQGIKISYDQHTKKVSSVCFLPGCDMIVSTGEDNSILFWSYDPIDVKSTGYGQNSTVLLSAISPSKQFVATVDEKQKLALWDVEGTSKLYQQKLEFVPTKLSFSDDEQHLVLERDDETTFTLSREHGKEVELDVEGVEQQASELEQELGYNEYVNLTPEIQGVGFTLQRKRVGYPSILESDDQMKAVIVSGTGVHFLKLVNPYMVGRNSESLKSVY